MTRSVKPAEQDAAPYKSISMVINSVSVCNGYLVFFSFRWLASFRPRLGTNENSQVHRANGQFSRGSILRSKRPTGVDNTGKSDKFRFLFSISFVSIINLFFFSASGSYS